jgi:DNA-binding response OmpR family regulator
MTPNFAPATRILIVEEDQETRDAIEKMLVTDGYIVDPARDAVDAIERARWRRPQLILISLIGDREELAVTGQIIRARAGLQEAVPVVLFSASAGPEGTEIRMAGNVHLTNPENFNHLRALVVRVLHASSGRA